MTSLETAKMAVKALDSKKALDIKVIKIQDISAIADYFVIATGTSSTHVKALADEVEPKRNGANAPFPFVFLWNLSGYLISTV